MVMHSASDATQAFSLALDIISVCWLIFVAIWTIAAVSTKRTVYRETRAQRLRYWVWLLIAYFLLLYGPRMAYPLNLRIVPHVAPTAWVAAILCATGLAFALWARVTLGSNWSGVVTLKEGHELVERGPYRFVRHPIYTGILTMFFATALALGHLAGFAGTLLMFASFWIKLRGEETLMLRQFPDRYAAYRQRAKRIIPFVL
jgi:protein-S-isoprenylcysteine O-methyltransferase Ste14